MLHCSNLISSHLLSISTLRYSGTNDAWWKIALIIGLPLLLVPLANRLRDSKIADKDDLAKSINSNLNKLRKNAKGIIKQAESLEVIHAEDKIVGEYAYQNFAVYAFLVIGVILVLFGLVFINNESGATMLFLVVGGGIIFGGIVGIVNHQKQSYTGKKYTLSNKHLCCINKSGELEFILSFDHLNNVKFKYETTTGKYGQEIILHTWLLIQESDQNKIHEIEITSLKHAATGKKFLNDFTQTLDEYVKQAS